MPDACQAQHQAGCFVCIRKPARPRDAALLELFYGGLRDRFGGAPPAFVRQNFGGVKQNVRVARASMA